ncbi:hypothetical protein ANO11243_025780 [Dothideomycetidae sp. 11243]|nr:hypothetical protein ANO11243_025780 [fungal sp. No.11243]
MVSVIVPDLLSQIVDREQDVGLNLVMADDPYAWGRVDVGRRINAVRHVASGLGGSGPARDHRLQQPNGDAHEHIPFGRSSTKVPRADTVAAHRRHHPVPQGLALSTFQPAFFPHNRPVPAGDSQLGSVAVPVPVPLSTPVSLCSLSVAHNNCPIVRTSSLPHDLLLSLVCSTGLLATSLRHRLRRRFLLLFFLPLIKYARRSE